MDRNRSNHNFKLPLSFQDVNMTTAAQLFNAMTTAGLNVVSVSLGKEDDPSTWKVQFAGSPKQADFDAAAAIITAFKPIADVPAPTLDKVVAALLAKGVLLPSDIL